MIRWIRVYVFLLLYGIIIIADGMLPIVAKLVYCVNQCAFYMSHLWSSLSSLFHSNWT